jgi:uncharacterized membrane protein
MLSLIIQRLHSKTYWIALIGSILTIAEANYNLFDFLLPPRLTVFGPLIWPIIMIFLRELTTKPLDEK